MKIQEIPLGRKGAADVLRVREATISDRVEPGYVRVRVHYSGVNFADVHMRAGLYVGAPKGTFVPGFEVSGVVEAVGEGVTSLKEGDLVMAGTLYGGYRSHVVLPAWQVIPLPAHLTPENGAALPVAFVTAYVALHEMARIRRGDRVLIDCATGGVGTIALQFARDAGCEVVGLTGSQRKFAHVETYGATPMLRETYDRDRSVGSFDVIINSSGGRTLVRDHDRLCPTGRLVSIGASSLLKNGRPDPASIASFLVHAFRPTALQRLFQDSKGFFGLSVNKLFTERLLTKTYLPAMRRTSVTPHVGHTFAAHDIAGAHRHLESGAASGKVVLRWN